MYCRNHRSYLILVMNTTWILVYTQWKLRKFTFTNYFTKILLLLNKAQCGKTRNSLSTKKNRQINSLAAYLVKPLLLLSRNSHSVEKREIHCHANFFLSNQFIVKFFSKTLIWRNFCTKTVAVQFRNFHSVTLWHCGVEKYNKTRSRQKISVK